MIVINTCAVREHAEMRVLGNVGALTHTKQQQARSGHLPVRLHAMQEPHMAEKIKKSFRHVDLVFGPHALWQFPEFLFEAADPPRAGVLHRRPATATSPRGCRWCGRAS